MTSHCTPPLPPTLLDAVPALLLVRDALLEHGVEVVHVLLREGHGALHAASAPRLRLGKGAEDREEVQRLREERRKRRAAKKAAKKAAAAEQATQQAAVPAEKTPEEVQRLAPRIDSAATFSECTHNPRFKFKNEFGIGILIRGSRKTSLA